MAAADFFLTIKVLIPYAIFLFLALVVSTLMTEYFDGLWNGKEGKR